MDSEPLFREHNFYDVIRGASFALAKAIEELDDTRLLEADQEKLLNDLVAAHLINVPVLDLDPGAVEPAQREVDIDLSRDAGQRFMHDLDGPYYVKGTEISFRVPYKGDEEVFRCRPSTWSSNPPYADIERDAIVIRVVDRDKGADAYRKAFDNTIAQIQENLSQLRSDCAGLEATLRSTATTELAKRRAKREKDYGLVNALGFGKSKA